MVILMENWTKMGDVHGPKGVKEVSVVLPVGWFKIREELAIGFFALKVGLFPVIAVHAAELVRITKTLPNACTSCATCRMYFWLVVWLLDHPPEEEELELEAEEQFRIMILQAAEPVTPAVASPLFLAFMEFFTCFFGLRVFDFLLDFLECPW